VEITTFAELRKSSTALSTFQLRLCVSTTSASLRFEARGLKPPPFVAQRLHPLVRIMPSLQQSPHHPPAIAQHTPSPSPIRLTIPRPASSQAATRPAKRRRMAKRATEDLSEAVAGPQDWFNDATADVPLSLSLLIDWLGSGNNFEAFKFCVRGQGTSSGGQGTM